MKRTAAALAVLVSLAVSADAFASETKRYLVATKRPFAQGAFRAVREAIRDGGAPLNLQGFRSFDGFAADLTAEDVAALSRSPEVRWIEPEIERHALDVLSPQSTPWGIDSVHAPGAWQARRSGEVNVVVIDTGVDYLHPDIAPMWAGGTRKIGSGSDPMDDNEHGTHVAGIVAASNNYFGVVGVAGVSGTRLWGVKVLDRWGSGTQGSVIAGIDWVLARKNEVGGRWVINLSLGAASSSNAERQSISNAIAAGIIVVAASGNGSSPGNPAAVVYPAAYPGVVSVGAIDDASAVASFSNQGPELELVAPGVDVMSTVPDFVGSVTSGAATYAAAQIEGSKRDNVSGSFVFCGLGKEGEFPAEVNGKIALIQRGEITFNAKTRRAKESGAIAVVIYNNVDDPALNFTLIDRDDTTPETEQQSIAYAWPVTLAVSKADGEALRAQGGTIDLTTFMVRDYVELNGTSMATPHVAGAAALLWAIAPEATDQQVITALTTTARDLGTPGQDSVFGFGAVDTEAAARQLAPAAFEPSTAPQTPTTGRRFGRRRG